MFDTQREELMWGGASSSSRRQDGPQADGAVVATYGETTVLATVVSMKEPKPASTSSRSR
jgi:polyribonucleotide nucleotidyltransferase